MLAIAPQHDDAGLMVFRPKHFGCREPNGPAANDDDLFGRAARSFVAWLWLRLFTLLAHPDPQIETGLMPGTP